MTTKEEFLAQFSDAVCDLDEEKVRELCESYTAEGYDAFEGITYGLIDGMNRASALFDEGEYYLSDIMMASEAMKTGIGMLKEHIETDDTASKDQIKVVMGTVEGDTHDLGKNLVKVLLEASGFYVIDLGRDVDLDEFAKAVEREQAQVLMMTSLMTTVMHGMKLVIDDLVKRGIRDQVKVLVGGAAVSQQFADEIGADGYSANAVAAVELVKRSVGLA